MHIQLLLSFEKDQQDNRMVYNSILNDCHRMLQYLFSSISSVFQPVH